MRDSLRCCFHKGEGVQTSVALPLSHYVSLHISRSIYCGVIILHAMSSCLHLRCHCFSQSFRLPFFFSQLSMTPSVHWSSVSHSQESLLFSPHLVFISSSPLLFYLSSPLSHTFTFCSLYNCALESKRRSRKGLLFHSIHFCSAFHCFSLSQYYFE